MGCLPSWSIRRSAPIQLSSVVVDLYTYVYMYIHVLTGHTSTRMRIWSMHVRTKRTLNLKMRIYARYRVQDDVRTTVYIISRTAVDYSSSFHF